MLRNRRAVPDHRRQARGVCHPSREVVGDADGWQRRALRQRVRKFTVIFPIPGETPRFIHSVRDMAKGEIEKIFRSAGVPCAAEHAKACRRTMPPG